MSIDKIRLAAVCTFGLEAVVKRELINLGYDNLLTDNGWIYFDARVGDIPRLNINLRSAERVMLVLGQFKVLSFEELFEKTYNLPWEDWISVDGKFTVKGKSVKSKLFSISDCQSIVKKAIVKKLSNKYDVDWFYENGAEYTTLVSVHKDIATLSIDTTGSREGLFKRGYKQKPTIAPLKETMSSALIQLSYWNKDRKLLDPMCGSGTIPIEAALIARNIAPGLNRTFASEKWERVDSSYWKKEKTEARRRIDLDCKVEIYGYDINRKTIEIAKENAIEAGVDDCIHFEVRDITKMKETPFNYGIMITNPPYGERIGSEINIVKIHKTLGKVFGNDKTWSNYIITSRQTFEKEYGRRADRKRKLYNGDVLVNYYQYYGLRPDSNK